MTYSHLVLLMYSDNALKQIGANTILQGNVHSCLFLPFITGL